MEDKKFKKISDQELEKVSGGFLSRDVSANLSPDVIVRCTGGCPGSPTNNTLTICPGCGTTTRWPVYENPGNYYPLYTKDWRSGFEVFSCTICYRAYYFNEAGELIRTNPICG
ncbi:MAG: bacteriocin [Clostridia bacterium]|nr:bacteriocin [Clostridia bacterium]